MDAYHRQYLFALEPFGCRNCGVPRPHGWQYDRSAGVHQWTQPTERQIKNRMRVRRRVLGEYRWIPRDGRTTWRKWT